MTQEEDPVIIRMNIAHYLAMLKLDINVEKRALAEQLLAEARGNLFRATGSSK